MTADDAFTQAALDAGFDKDASDSDLIWVDLSGKVAYAYKRDLDGMFFRQKAAIKSICLLLDGALDLVIMHAMGDSPSEDSLARERRDMDYMHRHVKGYQRLPQRSDIPPVYRAVGSAIDRGIVQTAELVLNAIEMAEYPEKLRIRREMRERTEQRRRERLANRARPEPTEMSPPPVLASKREKEERPPPCAKCGKRPRVSGTLCEPCAKWLARQ